MGLTSPPWGSSRPFSVPNPDTENAFFDPIHGPLERIDPSKGMPTFVSSPFPDKVVRFDKDAEAGSWGRGNGETCSRVPEGK